MKSNVLTIARKELARFFSNRGSAAVAILLPGVLIFGMWSLMGNAMDGMMGDEEPTSTKVGMVNSSPAVEAVLAASNIEVTSLDEVPATEAIREQIKAGDYQAVVELPAGFDEAIASYDPASGDAAPRVDIFYDATENSSVTTFSTLTALLDAYESSLSNRFDVNAGDSVYDVSDERSQAATVLVSIVPMMLLIMLFAGCMSIAAESIAGEKERGTMATLLATPIRRRDIALGKILSLTLIGVLSAISGAIGVFAGLVNMTSGALNINVYGPLEYGLLALVIFSTALVVVMLIAIISALAKTTKEAQLYLTPLYMVVIVIGLMGMFGDGSQTDMFWYLIPLYNSVQCMIGILVFDFQPLNVVICIVANIVYTGIGVFILQKMFNSERLMFAR